MKIVVCGLGYVGVTVAACMLRKGGTVVGIDVNPDKVAATAQGRSPVREPGVGELFAAGHAERRLKASSTLARQLDDADMVISCVGTPSQADGSLDLSHVAAVSTEIGQALRSRPKDRPPLVCVFRSTMLPGSMTNVVLPNLEAAAGEAPGLRYEPVYNPEFMRESTAIADFLDPPKIVIGERVAGAAGSFGGIYDGIDAPTFHVPYAVAELVKYVDNSFHAVKVSFANEIGRLAMTSGIDPAAVAKIFLADTKLNVSSYYLHPGGAFGGSCLPKDVRALTAYARERDLSVPVLDHLVSSNTAHKKFLADLVMSQVSRGGRVLQLGLTFKDDTDDLRESPLVDLAETLLDHGYDLRLFEPDLEPEQLMGGNLSFARRHLARLPELLVDDIGAEAAKADVIVIGKEMPGIGDLIPRGKTTINIHRLRHVQH